MDDSPLGREIEEVKGNPSGIIKRGEAITDLGEQMKEAAHKLEGMKNNSLEFSGQEGKAIESLGESIGESYEVLYKAAALYKPVGPVITAYGNELDDVQPLINSAVRDCESLWETYDGLPGEVEPRGTGGLFEPDADSPEADAQAKEDLAKKQAYDEWKARAEDFDSHYDTWESAFNTAVSGITEGTSGSIEDSIWSDITDFLEIAAFIVGVAALIIGTPFMAAFAMVVGALLLVATIVAYAKGERSMTDIIFAGIAVVPFGKVLKISGASRMFQAVRGAKGAKMGNVKTVLGQMNGLKGMRGFVSSVRSNGIVSTVKAGDGLIGIYSQRGAGPMLTKLFTGSERGFRDTRRFHNTMLHGAEQVMKNRRASTLTKVLMGADFGSQAIATNLDHIKLASLITPGVDFEIDLPGPLDRVIG